MNDIWELKEEKKSLLLKLKEKPVAIKKAILFAGHYSYFDKGGMRILLLVSTFFVGSFLIINLGGIGFFLPYIVWVGYDIYRMEELMEKYNTPIKKRLAEVNHLIDEHMKVKSAIEHTINFLGIRFNKKIS